jgi:small subunit ribosomal protein S6
VNTYEALIIFKPMLDLDNADNVLNAVEEIIKNVQGKVLKVDKMGRKRLAYDIRKFKDGFVTTFIVQMEPAAVERFKKACSLNEDILRLTFTRRDDYGLHPQPPAPPAGAGENAPHHRVR